MALSDMAMSSEEKKLQRIMLLQKGFREQKFYTVASAAKVMGGYAESTVRKWAKQGNVPLMEKKGGTVVPITDENSPQWLKEWLNNA